MFTIKNESESTRIELTQVKITGMNVNKEFSAINENVTVSVTAINNGKTGSKNITVYSNRFPVGFAEIQLQYLEEKTFEIPVNLKGMGINKITVSDAPQLFRNVFVQEAGAVASTDELNLFGRIKENILKVSIVVVFLVFAVILYYVRNKLKDESIIKVPSQGSIDDDAENSLSGLKHELTNKMDELSSKMKDLMKKKQ